jgi:cysteine desulfurase
MIYLDANSTSRIRPVALESAASFFGNPSSVHTAGRQARASLTNAENSIRSFLDVPKDAEIVFTSGGTESCNSLVLGFVAPGQRVLISPLEHPAITEPLSKIDSKIELMPLNSEGRVDVQGTSELDLSDTQLVCLMLASNESGAVQPVGELSLTLRDKGYTGTIVSDASQVPGKQDFSAAKLFEAGVSAIAVSAHKHGGPVGVGALLIAPCESDSCLLFRPLISGGPQQNRYRAGTENLPAIVAWGKVCEELKVSSVAEREHVSELRDSLWSNLTKSISGLSRLTPSTGPVLSNTLQILVEDCRADDLVVGLDLEGVCISTGSACASGKQEVSRVATQLGHSAEQASSVVRLSLDWDSAPEQLARVVEKFSTVVSRMREVESHPDSNGEVRGVGL